jgi:hypothetical protein
MTTNNHFVINTLATPLSVRQTVPSGSRTIFDWNGELVANAVTEDAATAIKVAVNAHEALVAAVRELLAAYAPNAQKSADEEGEQCLHTSVQRARAALNLADTSTADIGAEIASRL